ncbi:MAG: family 20 glycosylhydrolase [Verrucomicrobia bacterium]|nr:family 20 glycosylhydrolase [Verrucomicrobiota bacterium]
MKSTFPSFLALCLTVATGHWAGVVAAEPVAVPAEIKAYDIDFNWGPGGPNGFAKPGPWTEADPAELQGDERNIAALARAFLGLSQDAVRGGSAATAKPLPTARGADAAATTVHPALLPAPASIEWRDGVLRKDGSLRMEQVEGLPSQGYELEIAPTGAVIRSSTEAGAFYAPQTLRQLRAADGSLPGVLIRDAPRFAWRGLMLDSSRHFQTVDDIRRWLDLLAMHKLNVFHWHLVDGTFNESLFSDGLHPNAAGYAILGKALSTLPDTTGKPQ